MPRKRHDSSDEDSDSSLSDRNSKGKSKKSSKVKDKKQKASKGSKKRNVSESSSDAPPVKQRSAGERRKGQRRESESDTSPVKKSVQSRIQKPGNHGRDRRTNSREIQVDKRVPLASNTSLDRRRKRAPTGSPQGSRERPGLRSRSPELPPRALDRFPRRGERISPFEDRVEFRGRPMDFDRRDREDFERGLPPPVDYRDRLVPFDSRDRGEFLDRHSEKRDRFEPRGREMMRDPISPERGFPSRRNDRLSPDWRGGREAPGAMLYNRRSVSLERDQRFQRRQSISPVRKNERLRPISPRPMDSLPVIDRRERAVSPDRFDQRQRDHRSFSPDKNRQRVRRSISPEKPRVRRSDEIVDVSPVRKHRRENSFENDKNLVQKGKSGKGSKKKKASKNNTEGQVSSRNGKDRRKERSESLERSFERSKQSLIIPSEDREILKESKVESKKNGDVGKEINKSNKKKRPRSTSGSPQRVKKAKENDKNSSASTEKKGKKKGKKEKHSKSTTNHRSRSRSKSVDSLVLASMKKGKNKNSAKTSKASHSKKSLSRSPSPLPKSSRSDLNRSRSSDVSVGRKHDMAQFESEPESGEITDSEDDGKGLKSEVKKPILTEAEEKEQQEADAKYWNEKRKENKRQEEEIPQSSSRSNRENKRREHPGKRSRTNDEPKSADPKGEQGSAPPVKKLKGEGTQMLTGRTGGAYIPPARLRAMQASITDKSSVEYQRISWEALKKSINGLVNKVNVSNIENIVRELFQENIVRGRGLFARAIIQAQSASPTFTHVYAALVAIVNTKFPQNGELVLRRLIMQFRRGYKRNDKTICLSATRFVAHLVNQQVAHEVLALEILTLLLEEPTDDSVEVSIGFLKECGQKLTDVSPRGINAIFERLRNILHESQIDKRVQYMVEVMFAVRKDGFKDFPALEADLDLVEEEDQFTHLLTLEDAGNTEELLNVFRPDPEFQENEEKYKILKKEILGEDSSDEDGSGDDDDDDDSSDDEEEEESEEKKQTVIDNTETNMVALRRTIYLTIQSSLDFEECAHKLMKMDLKPGQEVELCNMILDCCAQMRTYEKFFGLLAGRFCVIDKKYVAPFQTMFQEQYETIHRLETNKLRNVGKFFSHLLFTDSISWAVLSCIKLNEEDTTSASRIFIKILFQELSEYMGLPKLNERLKDPTLMEYFVGLMPRDNPRDTRFAINFFTTIGLGGLTDDLREHLKDVSKKLMQQKQEEQLKAAAEEDSSDSSDSDSDSSSDSDNSSDSDSSSDSESSEDEKRKKNKKKPVEKHNDKERRKEKVVPQKEKERGRDKGKGREKEEGNEREMAKEKQRGREKEKGKGRDRIDNQMRDRKADKKAKKKQPTEAEQQKEREKQFKRLARLANYDEEIIDGGARSKRSLEREERPERKGKENGERRERRRKVGEREIERETRPIEVDVREHDYEDEQLIRGRQRARERDLYADRPLDRGYEAGAYERDDRLETVDRRRSGKRSKDFNDVDRHDPSIRVERNFERMDIYEDKFEQDRVRNLEYVRARPEFEDYYEGRGDGNRGRGVEREGRRRRELSREASPPQPPLEDAGFDARQYRDRAVSSDRRRNRSEERIPSAREPRRRRR